MAEPQSPAAGSEGTSHAHAHAREEALSAILDRAGEAAQEFVTSFKFNRELDPSKLFGSSEVFKNWWITVNGSFEVEVIGGISGREGLIKSEVSPGALESAVVAKWSWEENEFDSGFMRALAPIEVEWKILKFAHPFESHDQQSDEGYTLLEVSSEIELKLADGILFNCEFEAVKIKRNEDTRKFVGVKVLAVALKGGGFHEFKEVDLGRLGKWDIGVKFIPKCTIEPNWERILETMFVEMGAEAAATLGLAGAGIALLFYSQYRLMVEAAELEALPEKVDPMLLKIVPIFLDGIVKLQRPSNSIEAAIYDLGVERGEAIKKGVQARNSRITDEIYYAQVQAEVHADRDNVVDSLKLVQLLDPLARQMVFVEFAKAKRPTPFKLRVAWLNLFDHEDPDTRSPKHDPQLFHYVLKDIETRAPIGIHQYLDTSDQGLLKVATDLGSVCSPDEYADLSGNVTELADRYVDLLFSALAREERPATREGGAVYDWGKKLLDNARQKMVGPDLDEETFFSGVSAQVEKERSSGLHTSPFGDVERLQRPNMERLARLSLWLSYAYHQSRTSGRLVAWKSLMGKEPALSPDRNLFETVDDILRYGHFE